MTIHIDAQPDDIAETVLLPGDPLRAQSIAEHFLENAVLYNRVRNMLGFTGYYQGKRVSVQGTGMGIPSICIYANELIQNFGVKNLIRVGSAGSLQPDLRLREVVIALAASTDSAINLLRFRSASFAPTASFTLLQQAVAVAQSKGIAIRAGNVLSSDEFYPDDPDFWRPWAAFGVLCVEMETAGLYTVAAKHGVQALTLLTISDELVTGNHLSPNERQTSLNTMTEIALGLLP